MEFLLGDISFYTARKPPHLPLHSLYLFIAAFLFKLMGAQTQRINAD